MIARTLQACLLFLVAAAAVPARAEPLRRYTYRVVAEHPHDPGAFTQGLFFSEGHLYESTGQRGASSLRKVDLETGEVLQKRDLPAEFFGEGVVNWDDRIIGLTWTSGTGFVFDIDDFDERGRFAYSGQGWGLTQDGARLIMSDGTPQLRFLDPETLAETSRITVTLAGAPLPRLYELVWVEGEIFANVWLTNAIVRIEPASGQVTGIIDLTGLLSVADRAGGDTDVLNGIAYDPAAGRLFVTGKYWPKLFEIELVPAGSAPTP